MAKRYDPDRQHRRSIRLKGYDYRSVGAYFVTICTRQRECVLDDPVLAGIITDVWDALPVWFPTIALDEFVVMPNHVHLIVWLQEATQIDVGASLADIPDTNTSPLGVGAPLASAPYTCVPNRYLGRSFSPASSMVYLK